MKNNLHEIRTVAIIGLGALGVMYGNHLSKRMPKEDLRIIADSRRIDRYLRERIICNKEVCEFNYLTPEEDCEPADLVLFTVKYSGLKEAIKSVQNQIGKNTIIISALNGITSEGIIGKTYGMEKLLYCVAQGMDAVKEGNELTYSHMGYLVFGEKGKVTTFEKVNVVASFFEQMQLPYMVDYDMNQRMWGKLMLNVGVNQTAAINQGDFSELQEEGPARAMMIAAMREVITLSEAEGINLSEEDLNYWLKILGTLSPQGKPSMRQDLEAKRYSEVELFAGAVLELGKKHKIDTPVNKILYHKIIEIESGYGINSDMI